MKVISKFLANVFALFGAPSANLREANLQQEAKHPDEIIFWSCFGFSGPRPLVKFEGMMNSAQYFEILRKYAIPELEKRVKRDGCSLQDLAAKDCAPIS